MNAAQSIQVGSQINLYLRDPSLGHALSYLEDGTTIHIINGDLYANKQVRVKIIEIRETNGKKIALAEMSELSSTAQFIEKYQTKDGLIPASKLILRQSTLSAFELKGKLVFIHPIVSNLASYLLSTKHWEKADLRVVHNRRIMNRLPIYGVNFQKALNIALQQQFIKSLFYLPQPEKYLQNGFVADMVVNLKTQDRKILELEIWQQVLASEEVFYVHGLLNEHGEIFTHLDGSIIRYEPFDKDRLFRNGDKPKGKKKKYFRLDNNIEFKTALTLIQLFLPIEELVDEYFEVRKIE